MIDNSISEEAQDLIINLLKINSHERLSFSEIFVHKWFLRFIPNYDFGFLLNNAFDVN